VSASLYTSTCVPELASTLLRKIRNAFLTVLPLDVVDASLPELSRFLFKIPSAISSTASVANASASIAPVATAAALIAPAAN